MWILQSDWLIRLEKIFVILDNLGWYCGVANILIRQRQIQIVLYDIIVIKIEESLNFAVKIKLSGIFEMFAQVILV